MRLFKTRSMAADACAKGQIQMGGSTLKASRTLNTGDVFTVRRHGIVFTYKVLQLSENRLGAKLVPEYMQDLTTPDQLELLEMARFAQQMGRERGTGRPTKKERREIDAFFSDVFDE